MVLARGSFIQHRHSAEDNYKKIQAGIKKARSNIKKGQTFRHIKTDSQSVPEGVTTSSDSIITRPSAGPGFAVPTADV